jgi:Superinfection immunity protein
VNDVILGSIILIVLSVYFIPTIIARIRHTKHTSLIFSLNLITGWTVVGWIAGVIWAVAAHPLPKRGPAGSKPLEVDTWSFGSLKLSDRRQIEQADRWVLG